MIARIVVSAALAANITCAQTERPGSAGMRQPASAKPAVEKEIIPLHTAEPVVIRDGSVKIDIYSRDDTPVVIESPDTVIANAESGNQATLLVPVRVLRTGSGGLGRLQTASGLAHRMTAVRRYTLQIENLSKRGFVHYANLVFQLVKQTWHISPKGQNPLKLLGCSAPVALTGDWVNHFQSTCEYGYRNLPLRLGSVSVERATGAPIIIDLGTGCSAFRIEPFTHPEHRMPFDRPPCEGLQPVFSRTFPRVRVRGVKTIDAIDVSAAKRRASTTAADQTTPGAQE